MWVITSNLYLRAALIEIIVLNYRAILVPADCPDCLVIVGTLMVTPCGRCAPCRAWWNYEHKFRIQSLRDVACWPTVHCYVLPTVHWCHDVQCQQWCAAVLVVSWFMGPSPPHAAQRSGDLTLATTHLIIPGPIWIIMFIFNCMWHVATLDWGTSIVNYYFLYQFRMNTTCYKSLLQNYTELPIKVSIQQ